MIDAANTPSTAKPIMVGRKAMSLADAELAVRRSAVWFWVVAALSLINSIAAATGLKYRMVLGLGVTQLLDGFFPAGQFIHIALVLALVGLFFAFGFFARRCNLGWYAVGMIFYAVDAAVFMFVGDWIAVGFHAFVLLIFAQSRNTPMRRILWPNQRLERP